VPARSRDTASADPPPRSKLRIAAGAAAVLAVVLLAWLVPIPFRGRLPQSLGDLAHAPLFASITLGILWFWHRSRRQPPADDAGPRSPRSGRQSWWRCVGLFLLWAALTTFGVVIEKAQSSF